MRGRAIAAAALVAAALYLAAGLAAVAGPMRTADAALAAARQAGREALTAAAALPPPADFAAPAFAPADYTARLRAASRQAAAAGDGDAAARSAAASAAGGPAELPGWLTAPEGGLIRDRATRLSHARRALAAADRLLAATRREASSLEALVNAAQLYLAATQRLAAGDIEGCLTALTPAETALSVAGSAAAEGGFSASYDEVLRDYGAALELTAAGASALQHGEDVRAQQDEAALTRLGDQVAGISPAALLDRAYADRLAAAVTSELARA